MQWKVVEAEFPPGVFLPGVFPLLPIRRLHLPLSSRFLPSSFSLSLIHQGSASVHFQDFNRDVLLHLTAPNVAANLARSQAGDPPASPSSPLGAVAGNRTAAAAGSSGGGSRAGNEGGQAHGPVTRQAARTRQRQEVSKGGAEKGREEVSYGGERGGASAKGVADGHVKRGRSSGRADAGRGETNGVEEGEGAVDNARGVGAHRSSTATPGGDKSSVGLSGRTDGPGGEERRLSHAAETTTTTRFFAGDWKDLAPLLCGAVEVDWKVAGDSAAINPGCCSEVDSPQPDGAAEGEGKAVEGREAVGSYDIILTAETVYSPDYVRSLLSLVLKVCQEASRVVVVCCLRHRDVDLKAPDVLSVVQFLWACCSVLFFPAFVLAMWRFIVCVSRSA